MSKYTIELRRVCETFTREEVESWFTEWDLSDYLTPDEIKTINDRGTFNKEYLAKMIVDSYYFREIGAETVALFKHYVKLTMREIMGDYAQLIYSAAIKFDPLVNEDYTEDFTRGQKSQGSSSSSSEGTGFGITSDTPQSRLTKENLLNGSYATTATGDETTTSGSTNANGSEEETYKRKVRGNRGISSNAPYLIEQYRNYIRNIYGEIIGKVGICFMSLY